MKWLLLCVLVIPNAAWCKSNDLFFAHTPALSEKILEQQRGGFILPGINFSIGLTIEALVNGQKMLFSNLFDLNSRNNNSTTINNVADIVGLNITALKGNGQLGFVFNNAASGIHTDVNMKLDVVTPIDVNRVIENQRSSVRIRDAIRQGGY